MGNVHVFLGPSDTSVNSGYRFAVLRSSPISMLCLAILSEAFGLSSIIMLYYPKLCGTCPNPAEIELIEF